MPLAIGVRDALAALLVEHGLTAIEAEQLTRRTLGRWTRTASYLQAVAADGAWRHDLEGNRVESVAKEHTLAAAMGLLTSALRDNAKRAGVPSAPPKPPAANVTAETPPPAPASNTSTRSPLAPTTPPKSTTPTAPTTVTKTAVRPARPDPGPHRSTRPASKAPSK